MGWVHEPIKVAGATASPPANGNRKSALAFPENAGARRGRCSDVGFTNLRGGHGK